MNDLCLYWCWSKLRPLLFGYTMQSSSSSSSSSTPPPMTSQPSSCSQSPPHPPSPPRRTRRILSPPGQPRRVLHLSPAPPTAPLPRPSTSLWVQRPPQPSYWAALLAATEKDDDEAVVEMLGPGEPRSQWGQAAIAYAANQGFFFVVNMLLNVGVDPAVEDALGANALTHAAEGDHDGIVRLFVSKGRHAFRTQGGSLALCCAVLHNFYFTTHLLLRGGVPSTTCVPGDRPLLFYAAAFAADCLRELLSAGANPNVTDADQVTPLHWASKERNELSMFFLLAYGARSTAADAEGRTAYNVQPLRPSQRDFSVVATDRETWV